MGKRYLLFSLLISSCSDANSFGHEIRKSVVVALVDYGLTGDCILVLWLLSEGFDFFLSVSVAERSCLFAAFMAGEQADGVHPSVFIEEFG